MTMKQRLFRLFADLLYHLGVWQSLILVERLLGRRHQMVALLYHAVLPERDKQFEAPVTVDATDLKTFERHMRQFATWYAPTSYQGFEEVILGNGTMSEDRFLVTFDDAYRNNRVVAGPCLRRNNIPALIFVPTAYVETERRFWWLRLRDVLNEISESQWRAAVAALTAPRSVVDLLAKTPISDREERGRIHRSLVQLLDSLDAEEQEHVVSHFQQFCSLPSDSTMSLLNWREMRDMQNEGFAFGAHTHSHPRLSRLETAEIRHELCRNVELLERNLGSVARSFAYPHGDYDDAVLHEVREGAFLAAFTDKPGEIVVDGLDRYQLPRLQLYRTRKGEIAMTILALKLMKYWPSVMGRIVFRLAA